MDKLIVAIVHTRRNKKLKDALLEAGFRLTELLSSGGFLGKKSSTFLIGVEKKQLNKALDIIRANCKKKSYFLSSAIEPSEAMLDLPIANNAAKMEFGGAIVFVLDIEKAEKI